MIFINKNLLNDFISTLNLDEYKNYYYYHNIKEVQNKYNLSQANIKYINKLYSIKIPDSLRVEKIKQTKLSRYNDSNYNNINKIKLDIDNKYKNLDINKLDLQTLYINDNLSIKSIATKYNVSISTIKKLLKLYKIVKPKSLINKCRINSIEKTNIEKYGTNCFFKTDQYKESLKNTCLEKYGVEHFTQSKEYKNKVSNKDCLNKRLSNSYKTKKKNNSFNKSQPEEDYYQYLLTQYEKEDIIRQYKSEEYPFNCDFYIVSENKYIECNYSWTHGDHMFDSNNKEDLELLDLWKSKSNGKDYYSNAIKTWTIRDIEKVKIAKENNLNIEFIY